MSTERCGWHADVLRLCLQKSNDVENLFSCKKLNWQQQRSVFFFCNEWDALRMLTLHKNAGGVTVRMPECPNVDCCHLHCNNVQTSQQQTNVFSSRCSFASENRDMPFASWKLKKRQTCPHCIHFSVIESQMELFEVQQMCSCRVICSHSVSQDPHCVTCVISFSMMCNEAVLCQLNAMQCFVLGKNNQLKMIKDDQHLMGLVLLMTKKLPISLQIEHFLEHNNKLNTSTWCLECEGLLRLEMVLSVSQWSVILSMLAEWVAKQG